MFGPDVTSAYDETCPLAHGWRERTALSQIVPLVAHAIKFSGGYVGSASAIVDISDAQDRLDPVSRTEG